MFAGPKIQRLIKLLRSTFKMPKKETTSMVRRKIIKEKHFTKNSIILR